MPIEIDIDYETGVPVYRQIYDGVLASLATNILDKGEQLPTIHELAKRLSVNPNTVARAYRDLERDGYLSAQRGRGTFPAEEKRPRGKNIVLQQILDRALAHGARYRLSPTEIINYFGGAKTC